MCVFVFVLFISIRRDHGVPAWNNIMREKHTHKHRQTDTDLTVPILRVSAHRNNHQKE